MVHSGCLLAFWIQLSHFWRVSSSIGSSINTHFNLCCSSKCSGSVLNCISQHSSNWSETHIPVIWANLWCLCSTHQVLVKKPYLVSNVQYSHAPSVWGSACDALSRENHFLPSPSLNFHIPGAQRLHTLSFPSLTSTFTNLVACTRMHKSMKLKLPQNRNLNQETIC